MGHVRRFGRAKTVMALLVLLFVASLAAFGLSAISGGGASLLLVPILGHAVPVASVPAALSLGTCSSSVSRMATFRRHIRWEIARWFVPAGVPMALVGAISLRLMNPAYVQLLMALFLVANLPKLLTRERATPRARRSRAVLLGVGATAGFLSGLTGAVGVLFNRFYFSYGLTRQEVVATRATNEVLIHVAKLIVYASLGLMDRRVVLVGLVVAAAATLSSLLLKPLLQRISHESFVRVGYAAMVAAGIALLGSTSARVAREGQLAFEAGPILHGAGAKIQWRQSSLALEVEYDDGVEVEVAVSLADLTSGQRQRVSAEDPGSDAILLEAVYGFGQRYHEAYYLRNAVVVKKVAFDGDGKPVPQHD